MAKILLVVCLACMFLLFSCSNRRTDAETSAPPETTPPPETVQDTTAEETFVTVFPGVPGPAEPRFVSNKGNLTLHTFQPDAEQYHTLALDDTRTLIVMYDRMRDKDYNLVLTDGHATITNLRVVIYDCTTGKTGEAAALSGNVIPSSISYTADGCVLRGYDYASDRTAAWRVTADGTNLTVTPTEDDGLTRTQYIASPDGKYTAYTVTDESVSGGIMLESADGAVMILKNSIYGIDVDNISHVRGYTPVGFLDSERLVYNITGWEWAVGYGIYNAKTGENKRFEVGCHVSGIADGILYGASGNYDGLQKIYRLGENGLLTGLAETSPIADTVSAVLKQPQFLSKFSGGRWLIAPYSGENFTHLNTVYIFSADLTRLEAEIYYEIATGMWLLSGDSVAAVISG